MLQNQVNLKPTAQISEELGCATATVLRWIRRLNIVVPAEPIRRPPKTKREPNYHIGERFGKLVVVSGVPKSETPKGSAKVNVKCDCGGEKTIRTTVLLNKGYGWDSCGCLTVEKQQATMDELHPGWMVNTGLCNHPDGCEREAFSMGLCGSHYRENWLNRKEDCHIEECENPIAHEPHGLCSKHEWRYKEYGDPYFEYDWTGYRVDLPKGKYRGKRVDGKTIPEHRWVMQEWLGRPLEPEEEVHHLNGVRHDNDIDNLELWSKSQPAGQRVRDKVIHAMKMLELYGDLFPEIVLSREEYELRMAI